MGSKLPHDVSPILQSLRNLLLGRVHVSPVRFPERIADRTQPPPVLPEGCSSKFANNYYYTRDGRRCVTPAEVVVVNKASGEKLLIASKSTNKSDKAVTVTEKKAKTPGPMYIPPIVGL